MRVIVLSLALFTLSTTVQGAMLMVQTKDYQGEIASLLKQLVPVERIDERGIVIEGPSLQTQREVPNRLLQIANESSDTRSFVIRALIKILEDPGSKEESVIAHRWTTAVDVLGDLRSIDAIDLLVQNLDQTGQNGIIISIHYRPVARAIAKIGEPAVPRLIEALSDEKPGIRREAASTLARIGPSAIPKLRESLRSGSVQTKGGSALALAWIGGKQARAAIEHAIESETDQEAVRKLEEALKEMRRVWGR